jgi:pyruvate dehydrogenase E1 component beta subunit
MAKAINQALDGALAADPSVFLLGEDIADPGGGVFTVTNGLSTRYGTDRVRATPISEEAILGVAIGAAVAGFRPVAEIMIMDFLGVCLDQLANHAAKLRYMSGGLTSVPLTVRCSAGGGLQMGAQHS